MARELFAITAPTIEDTGLVSFGFIFDSKAPIEQVQHLWGRYGFIKLEKKGSDYVDPFRLARNEPGAVGDDGVMRLHYNMFASGKGLESAASWDDSPDDAGLQEAIEGMDDGVLLMDRSLFDRFERACQAKGVKLGRHHCEHALTTGKRNTEVA